ncbi:MAG: TIGR00153 family protein [Myxococcota bacterium]
MRIPLASLLVRSPLPRVGELMVRVVECAEKVPEIVARVSEGNHPALIELAKQTSILEGKADDAKNDVRQHMPTRLFLPVDRRDVLRLISEIDAIADAAEDVGVLVTLRPLDVPEEMQTLLKLFVERVVDTVKSAGALVGMIDDLLESGFGGKAAERVRAAIDEVHRKEHEADKLQDQCAKVLFKLEDQMSPVALFMWTKVLNKIGDMANHAENVGDQFRLFIAR